MSKKIEVLSVQAEQYSKTIDLHWQVRDSYVEFTPKQARKFAKRILAAADEVDPNG